MARKPAAPLPPPGEIEWLGQVREVRHPLDPSHPYRVSNNRTTGSLLRPTVPYPERHPFCEFNCAIKGRGEQFVGLEKMERSEDLMVLGPGIPHYGTVLAYPHQVIVVHFLPVLLFELSPVEGARILARFTASQSISQRVVRPPKALYQKFISLFASMAEEFAQGEAGWDLCVRARLLDALVTLLRWEDSIGVVISHPPTFPNWAQIEKVLQFIYQHFTEPIYIEQIAREAGMSIDRLHALFREAFGMTCIQYLSAYRISHATSLLCLPGARVTEVAPAVGFETLSHFNSAFRRAQGMSPTDYMRLRKASK